MVVVFRLGEGSQPAKAYTVHHWGESAPATNEQEADHTPRVLAVANRQEDAAFFTSTNVEMTCVVPFARLGSRFRAQKKRQ